MGLGYVGLTLAISAADRGIEVYGTEINPKIKECLREDRAHFYEPGLDELIAKHNRKNFYCVEEFPSDKKFDAFVITVGTPLKPGTHDPNFDHIRQALVPIFTGGGRRQDQLIILRSTVSVGTTRNVVLPFLKELNGSDDVLVSMCPERTIEGKAIEELRHLPQIISGNNQCAIDRASEIFSRITDKLIVADSLEEAELIKLYNNTYRDMNFALGNAFCLAAQTFGIDGTRVIKHANEGYARSRIALPGFVAGPCLEKDSYILTDNMIDCDEKDFILGARHINESLENAVVDWVRKHVGAPSSDDVITLSGMAFKGRPATSDLRGSSSVNIARKLHALGYKLQLHDFAADPLELKDLNVGDVVDDLNEACRRSKALLILNNHEKYSELRLLRADMLILDAWDVCRELSGKAFTLGNMNIDRRSA